MVNFYILVRFLWKYLALDRPGGEIIRFRFLGGLQRTETTWPGCAVDRLRCTKATIRYAIRTTRVTVAAGHLVTVVPATSIAAVPRARTTGKIHRSSWTPRPDPLCPWRGTIWTRKKACVEGDLRTKNTAGPCSISTVIINVLCDDKSFVVQVWTKNSENQRRVPHLQPRRRQRVLLFER